ncbi:hypothetical protein BDZ88DRAFT_480544 [Geranomyces variabilis]|nr:hypothetical protein BDZ88DRAFT_480544 [Geranomyces variabilis]KAJ3136468.1 hypothetical protein HDU90_003179 [Geranomyces variabilis]
MTSISLVPADLRLGGAEVTDEFVAAYVRVYQDELDADSQFQPPTAPPTTSTLLSRDNRVARFYGLLPVSAAIARHLLDSPNGFFLTEAFQRCQTHPYGKLANFSQRFTEIGRTIKLEADLESPVTEVHASQPLGLVLYIKQISVYINKWKELLEKHLTIRPGDRVWVQLLLSNPPQILNHDRAYLYYVGITIRNPGLRLTEPMLPSAANSRQAAFVKAAELTGALHNMYMYEIVRKDIPVAAGDRNKGLSFNLRTQPAICDMERFVRLLFHIRALNRSPGGIDHTFHLTRTSATTIEDAAAAAGALLPDNWAPSLSMTGAKATGLTQLYSGMPDSFYRVLSDIEKASIVSQLVTNLSLTPVGQGPADQAVTARIGKDPSLEDSETGTEFYDTQKGGLGPRTHTRIVLSFYQQIADTNFNMPQNANSAFLGPFRNLFESLKFLNDRETALYWLQQVLQYLKPWHVITLGSPTLGVFVHSLLHDNIGDPNTSAAGSSSNVRRSCFGRPLDSRWDLRGAYVDAIGVPFIARYGAGSDDFAIVTGSYDPGVFKHDYVLAPLRHEISALVIAQEGIITATIAHVLKSEYHAAKASHASFRRDLLVKTILPQVRAECERIGLTARLDALKDLAKIHAQHLQRMRRGVVDSGGGREPEDSTADSATAAERRRCEIIMQGTPARLDADPSQARVTQVDGLVAARREMVEQFNAGALMHLNLPISKRYRDAAKIEDWRRFLLCLGQGVNAFGRATWGESKPAGTTEMSRKRKAEAELRRAKMTPFTEQLIRDVGQRTWPQSITRARFYNIVVCPAQGHEEFEVVSGKKAAAAITQHVQSHGDPGFSDRSLVHKDRVLFLHQVVSVETQDKYDLEGLVRFVSIDELLPYEDALQNYDSATYNQWKVVLARGKVIPMLVSVLNDLHSLDYLDDEVDQGGHRDTPRVTDDDGPVDTDPAGDVVPDNDPTTEAIENRHRAAEYAVIVALNFIFRSKIEDEELGGRWKGGNPATHTCATDAPGGTTAGRWLNLSATPDFQSFAQLPGRFQARLHEELVFSKSGNLQALYAQHGITAKNLMFWRTKARDNVRGAGPIPDSIRNATPVALTTIEWTPKVTRRPRVDPQKLAQIRNEIRQFRLNSVGRRQSSLNKECYRLLADRGIPGQERVTILRPIINEARRALNANAPDFSENFYPSQGSSFLEEDDDGRIVTEMDPFEWNPSR